MAKPKISPLRVASIEDAQRAIDQLAERVNELSDDSSTAYIVEETKFTVGEAVVIRHKLGKVPSTVDSKNGLNISVVKKTKDAVTVVVQPWECFDHRELTAATDEINFDSDVIDGDLDRVYRFEFMPWINDAGAVRTLEIYFNGTSPGTAADANQLEHENATVLAADLSGTGGAGLMDTVGNRANNSLIVYMYARSGETRGWFGIGQSQASISHFGGWWNNNSTKITSLLFRSASNALYDNTEIWAYRMVPRETTIRLALA